MSVRDVSFSYDSEIPLINNLSFTIGPRDRICVVGRNGKGKTTLLKLLAGAIIPKTGEITCNPNAKKGYFEQTNIKSLIGKRTVEEEILYSYPEIDRQIARNICGAMMFDGDNALKKIEVLSGGEKSRVMLGKLIVTPFNLLLLDEPTNHLDMESCDALLSAIDRFEGAAIIVTHNEMFLHALAERLIVFQDDRIFVFEGTYNDFLDKCGWGDEEMPLNTFSSDDCRSSKRSNLNKREVRRRRSEIITRRTSVLKPLESRIAQLENDIDSLEKKLSLLNKDMVESSHAQEGARIAELSQSIHNCKSAIDNFFDELEEKTILLEEKSAMFEKELNQLEHPADIKEYPSSHAL